MSITLAAMYQEAERTRALHGTSFVRFTPVTAADHARLDTAIAKRARRAAKAAAATARDTIRNTDTRW